MSLDRPLPWHLSAQFISLGGSIPPRQKDTHYSGGCNQLRLTAFGKEAAGKKTSKQTKKRHQQVQKNLSFIKPEHEISPVLQSGRFHPLFHCVGVTMSFYYIFPSSELLLLFFYPYCFLQIIREL